MGSIIKNKYSQFLRKKKLTKSTLLNINVARAKPLLIIALAINDNESTVESKETIDEKAPKEVVELITSKKTYCTDCR